jgi:pyruvate formate lyase activating enzyme
MALLNTLGAHTVLRCPILPDINLTDAHFDGLAALAEKFSCIRQFDLEPYHPLGISKAERLGRPAAYANTELMDKKLLEPFAARLRERTGLPVNIQ